MCKYTIDTNIYIHIYTHNINNPYFPIFDFTLKYKNQFIRKKNILPTTTMMLNVSPHSSVI